MKSEEALDRKAIRAALKTWHSSRELGLHPLARLRIVEDQRIAMRRDDTPVGRGLSLRDVLQSAIESLRYGGDDPDYSKKGWRAYIILVEEFVKGQAAYDVMERLHIAERTYQLERSEAIDGLGEVLRQLEDESRGIPFREEAPFLAPPKPPYRLVGRFKAMQEVKGLLFSGGSIALCALNGLPGVGKTALAIELAHDSDVRGHFRDGILWAGLGREPDRMTWLGTWLQALGVSPDEMRQLSTIDDRAAAVHRAISMKRLLLVIDDVWQLDHALTFRIGGPNCAHLVTTRLPEVARDFAEEKVVRVEELSEPGALALMGQLAPAVVEASPDEAQELVRGVGGLPLAIILMAKYVRRLPDPDEALQRLREVEETMKLAEPQAPVWRHPSLPAGASLSLQAVIGASVEVLDDAARGALYALSVFPPKPNTFSEEAALAVTAESPETIARLADSGLLENSGSSRYTLHQVIAEYARQRLSNKDAWKRMVTFFVDYVDAHKRDYNVLDQEVKNILVALEQAHERQMPAALVRGTIALYDFQAERALYELAEPLFDRARETAKALGDVAGQTMASYGLGAIAQHRGNYAQAGEHLRESLSLAYSTGNINMACATLTYLGTVELHIGHPSQAEEHWQSALTLAREVGNDEEACYAFMNLGILADIRGDYEQAEEFMRQGLALSLKIGDSRSSCALLSNLGVVRLNRGDYEQAEQWLWKSLAVAREIGNPRRICSVLTSLGAMEYARGNFARAEEYWEEGLTWARQAGSERDISVLLGNLGELACNHGDYEQASKHLLEALRLAREVGHREDLLYILDSLGKLEIARSCYAEAEQYLLEGLGLANDMQYLEILSSVLRGLGMVAFRLGNYEKASEHWQKGLEVARQTGHRANTAAVLIAEGELYLVQGKETLAFDVFSEALSLATDLGNQLLEADALYGLARVASAQGNAVEARQRGQESLAILERIGHEEAAQVRAWLDGICAQNSSR